MTGQFPARVPSRPLAPMSAAQIAVKLEQIKALTLAEIEGWRQGALSSRAPFDGELAALTAREKELRNAG